MLLFVETVSPEVQEKCTTTNDYGGGPRWGGSRACAEVSVQDWLQ